ncbi:E3 SUMO-protein ligase ZNF451 isoform X2 [Haemorhous mexicanus]|uniref:E3 SUMO-protein ligase ZNF451 isoform X2 n=1 Tax=Haemorhous mexicanus TaxID=30427 RepID=UPI0028BD8E5E|nr:E3 SUMO-protein ligase ZNF451 isoform X2 [Haemorhous mexicanus]
MESHNSDSLCKSKSPASGSEDEIEFIGEGPLRPVLECIDLISSEDEEPNSSSYFHRNTKRKDHIDYQKERVASTLDRLARHVEVEKQQKEEKNKAFKEKVDSQYAHGLQELEFIREHSDTEAARLCVDQWLKMPGLKPGSVNGGRKDIFKRMGQTRVNSRPKCCPVMHCNRQFDNVHLLLGHLQRFDHSPCDPTVTLHGPPHNAFACVICCEKFSTSQQYSDHLLSKLNENDGHKKGIPPQHIQCFACPKCFLLFTKRDECWQHMSQQKHVQVSELSDAVKSGDPLPFPSFAKNLLISLCKEVSFQVKCMSCFKILRSHMELTAHFRTRCYNSGPMALSKKSISQVAEIFKMRGHCENCDELFADKNQMTQHKQTTQHNVRVFTTLEESILMFCHVNGKHKNQSHLAYTAERSRPLLKRHLSPDEPSSEMGSSPSKRRSNSKDGELPDLDYLSTMTHIVLVDLDNWGSFFTQLPANLNQGTFIWGFQGGYSNWKPPVHCKIYNYLKRIGCFFLHPRCSTRREAADFALCVHAGRLDEHLPKQIPFTVLSGDKSFLELENQFKMTQRSARILNPHHIEGDMMCALLNSISDTTKGLDSEEDEDMKETLKRSLEETNKQEELQDTELQDAELQEAIKRSLEEM